MYEFKQKAVDTPNYQVNTENVIRVDVGVCAGVGVECVGVLMKEKRRQKH